MSLRTLLYILPIHHLLLIVQKTYFVMFLGYLSSFNEKTTFISLQMPAHFKLKRCVTADCSYRSNGYRVFWAHFKSSSRGLHPVKRSITASSVDQNLWSGTKQKKCSSLLYRSEYVYPLLFDLWIS